MELPSTIKKEILDYLHLEFGEDPGDPKSLKLEDIEYKGLFNISGLDIHYFQYKTSTGYSWATVEPFNDTYMLGMTTSSPVPVNKAEFYKALHIESMDDDFDFSTEIELESWGEGCFGLSDYKKIRLSDAVEIEVLAEVSAHSIPTAVTLSIRENGNDIYLSGSVGVSLNYKTNSCLELHFSLGYID